MQQWMEISGRLSCTKMPIIKFRDLLNECNRKDKVIEELDSEIEQLKSNEATIMTTIHMLKRANSQNQLEMFKYAGRQQTKIGGVLEESSPSSSSNDDLSAGFPKSNN